MSTKVKIYIVMAVSFLVVFSLAARTVSFQYDESGNRVLRFTRATVTTDTVYSESTRKMINSKTDVQDLTLGNEVKISACPNPTDGPFNVSVTGLDKESECKLSIYDAAGRNILSVSMSENPMQLDFSDKIPGVYMLHVVTGQKKETIKIIRK